MNLLAAKNYPIELPRLYFNTVSLLYKFGA